MFLDILLYLLLFVVLGGGGFIGYLFLQQHLNGTKGSPLFGPKPEKRLDVVEQWNLDARRKLVLIRRDSVEHLIMTGGPVDVVIETGISASPRKAAAPAQEVFSRPARSFGTAAAPQPAAAASVQTPAAAVNGTKPE